MGLRISEVSSVEQTHMLGGGRMPASENDHPFLMAGTSPGEHPTRTTCGGPGWCGEKGAVSSIGLLREDAVK